ncbi:MAG: DUF2779 domain-containing protein [Candidatus Falkowbacteria bacterium]
MLTKSDYLKFIQCSKYLWLAKFRKDLLPEDVDVNLQKVFDEGFRVETYAYKLFPGGVDAQVEGFAESIELTKELMAKKMPIIFQPTIRGKNLFCRSDIVVLNDDGQSWDIYEVKSSTMVKDLNVHDLSFQKACFEEAGLKVGNVNMIHINNQYIKDGDINPHELLTIVSLREEIKAKEVETKDNIADALRVLKVKEEPTVRILKQCDNPFTCLFIPHCWKDFPEHSIYSIAGALGKKRLEALLDEGILEIKDIPPELLTSDKLIRHHHAVTHNLVHIEKDNIKDDLAQIDYPIYFLDYETNGPAIPIIDGYRPYQRIVFQYSLHILDYPGAELKHYYFLAKDASDPTKAMAESLKSLISEDGTIIAWNMGFEKGCNSEMGGRDKDYKLFFEDINNRMYDLMLIFKKGYYVHKDFHGSASLKKVLPVVVPELSYKGLGIQEGMAASNKWGDMVSPGFPEADKDKTYNDLLEYCELDTLAMVKILENLNNL